MSARKSKATDPWAAMDEMLAADKEPTGPDWFTVEQLMARYGLSQAGTHAKLKRLHAQGRVEKWFGFSFATRRRITKFRAVA